MTVCGNSLSGVCGACKHLQRCRKSELDKVPKTNYELMQNCSMEEMAEMLKEWVDCAFCPASDGCSELNWDCKKRFLRWLKEAHEK